MAKSDELIKYITQRVVTYIDTPRDERLKVKETIKGKRGRWDVHWFGMLPLAMGMWFKETRSAWQSLRKRAARWKDGTGKVSREEERAGNGG
ncbi:YqzE family protein [Paenibacillus chartarius]|uniref:YqzE family protein n=1 Tax=Paenibacillus chartarius TaxID=747481 RepID=A0ABV6DEU6_9BACL